MLLNVFFLVNRQPPRSTLFPYTPLFRPAQFGERFPRREPVVLHDLIGGGDAEHERVADRAVAPRDVSRGGGPPRLQRDRLRVRNGALDVWDILGRDDRTALDPAPRFVVDESHLDRLAPALERVQAHDR